MKAYSWIMAAGLLASGHVMADAHKDHNSMGEAEMQAHHKVMLAEAVAGTWRSEANKARDSYRHPQETLAFFGVTPHSKLMEIWPGGGWYAEILIPYVSHHGSYTGAVNDPASVPERQRDYYGKQNQALRDKFAGNADLFGKATVLTFNPAQPVLGAPGSMDTVLTFRNVHNWRMAQQAEGMFKAFFAVLKPGGVLGVVEHRAQSDVPADDKSGGRGCRVPLGRQERNQCQSKRHQKLYRRCLDAATDTA